MHSTVRALFRQCSWGHHVFMGSGVWHHVFGEKKNMCSWTVYSRSWIRVIGDVMRRQRHDCWWALCRLCVLRLHECTAVCVWIMFMVFAFKLDIAVKFKHIRWKCGEVFVLYRVVVCSVCADDGWDGQRIGFHPSLRTPGWLTPFHTFSLSLSFTHSLCLPIKYSFSPLSFFCPIL